MNKKRVIINIASVVLLCVMAYSGYQLFLIYDGYRQADLVKEAFAEYKPILPDTAQESKETVNQSVLDMQALNPDIIGWLTVDGTQMDYPFVYSKDNNDYLRRDLNGKYAVAGTIFMDYQCKADLSDFNTILYGHQMKNGSMFGDIAKFAKEDFWNGHTGGYIYLAYASYRLDIFSYAVVDRYDEIIYTPHSGADAVERTAVLDYIRINSRQYRDIGITASDQIVTLSTCNYEYNGARAVLVAKLVRVA